MFTGLVADLGTLTRVMAVGTGRTLWIESAFENLELGESIACDGVCLTVERWEGRQFVVTAGEETLRRTTWGDRQAGHRVHLERALRLSDRLGGHIVQGHVDGVGVVRRRIPHPGWLGIEVEAPVSLSRYLVGKGSVCMDGVSLTVNEVSGSIFSVGIIPHTQKVTRITALAPGERVNIEVDVLAKYVERLLGQAPAGGLDLQKLRENGFA